MNFSNILGPIVSVSEHCRQLYCVFVSMLLTAATRVRFRSRLFVCACERACVSGIIQIYGRISDILLFVRTSQRLAPRNKISAA